MAKQPKPTAAQIAEKRNWKAIVNFHDGSQTIIDFDTWPEFDGTLADGPPREWIKNIIVMPNQIPIGASMTEYTWDDMLSPTIRGPMHSA